MSAPSPLYLFSVGALFDASQREWVCFVPQQASPVRIPDPDGKLSRRDAIELASERLILLAILDEFEAGMVSA